MALQLNIHEVPHFIIGKVEDGKDQAGNSLYKEDYLTSDTVTLMTDRVTKELYFTLNAGETKDKAHRYVLGLVYFDFQKKMYQPTEITATIQIRPFETRTSQEPWYRLSMERIVELFKGKKVSVYDMDGFNGTTIADNKKVGEDFYVQEVVPKYLKTSMNLVLKINSLDKLMTLEKTSRSFVAKKLGAQIMADNLKTYKKPYVKNDTIGVEFDTSNMKVLAFNQDVMSKTEKSTDDDPKFEQKNIKTEHIFPLLMQYNESFYDMLARTCNRWGEFMYYESGKLNVGYPKKKKEDIIAITHEKIDDDKFNTIQYINLDENVGENNDRVVKYDEDLLTTTQETDPNSVSGILLSPGKKWDKVLMKTITSFLKNDKSLPTYLGNLAFDSLYDLAVKEIAVAHDNDKHNGKYFDKKDMVKYPEQFTTDQKQHNLFTEIVNNYNVLKYYKILAQEDAASKNAVYIDFDTNYPCLNLGDIIDVYGENYIVVQVNGGPKNQQKVKDDLWVIPYNENSPYVYQVIATPIEKDDKGKAVTDGQFYPTILPTGHVRYAEPQLASVTDAEDPDDEGRVRVKYDWQGKDDEASPWLRFTANAGGQKGLMGKHYKGDVVYVGYIDGNIERPYVMGALSQGASKDIHCESPGGHTLTVYDDKNGIKNFLTGMFLPGYSTLSDFVPAVAEGNAFKDAENNLALAGGFELTDKYGLYKISGSTDKRNVSVSSPWGDVKIDAFMGITISAPNGDVKISGKNVTIEAGNNLKLVSGKNVDYKLWKEKDSRTGSAAQFFLDIPVQVAKKLAETLTDVVDLTIIRNVVEIVMRPIEGNLTVKSNRFLMLEAGKTKCAYPVTAYKASKEELVKKLDDEKKADILAGTRKILGVGKAMEQIFASIDGVVDTLDGRFVEHYNKAFGLRGQLESAIAAFDSWKNKPNDNNDFVCGKSFDNLFTDSLKDKLFGQGKEFKEFTESDLEFADTVKTEGDAGDAVSEECDEAHGIDLNVATDEEIQKVDEMIVAKRKALKKAAVKALNKLAKECHYLVNFDMKRIYAKGMPSLTFTPAPAEFKDKMTSALSKEKLPNGILYNLTDDDKKLNGTYDTHSLTASGKLYTKRLVAMNLVEEFGFYLKDLASADAGYAIDKAVFDSGNNASVLNDTTWNKYVERISGLPALGNEHNTFVDIAGDIVSDVWNKIKLWDSKTERSVWSQGSEGRILYGVKKNTYVLDGKEIKDAEVAEATFSTLKGNEDILDDTEKDRVKNFVGKIQENLKNIKIN